MLENLWLFWGIASAVLDLINPYVSIYGAVPQSIFLILLCFMWIGIKVFRRKAKVRRILKSCYWTVTALILQISLVIKLTFFVLTTDLITGVCHPSEFIPWTINTTIQTCTIFFIESSILHIMMCIGFQKKLEHGKRVCR